MVPSRSISHYHKFHLDRAIAAEASVVPRQRLVASLIFAHIVGIQSLTFVTGCGHPESRMVTNVLGQSP
jgi:hypothetical protein